MKWVMATILLLAVLAACGGREAVPTATSTPGPTATPAAGMAVASPIPTDPRRATPTPAPESTPKAAIPAATTTPTVTPSAAVPAPPFPVVIATGLIATIPGYARLDVSQTAELIKQVYPGRVQSLVLLTEDDEAYLVLALDTDIDRFITAGTVTGYRLPPLPGLPAELDFAGRLIISDDVQLMEPVRVTADQVNQNPEQYAFKRVITHTTYVFISVRAKDAPPSLDHIGFALASDKFGNPTPRGPKDATGYSPTSTIKRI